MAMETLAEGRFLFEAYAGADPRRGRNRSRRMRGHGNGHSNLLCSRM